MSNGECEEAAAALNATFAPTLLLAIAVLESDLREDALARARRGVYDTGWMGIRCKLAPGSDRTTRRDWRTDTQREKLLASPCTNWPVKGRPLSDLLTVSVSIEAAERILKQKRKRSPKHWLRHYNGGTSEHGYAESVHAIKMALFGRLIPSVFPRVEHLAREITQALKE